MDSVIEMLAKQEYEDGVSAGAALRQLCRSIENAPTLKRLIEDELADFNRQSHALSECHREIFKLRERILSSPVATS